MAIFDFGDRQRMHTQLVGNTSGREMFKVDEYNQRKSATIGTGFFLFGLFTLFYFAGQYIPTKILIFLIILSVGLCYYFYINFTQQRRLREVLY